MYIPKRIENRFKQVLYTPVFTAALFATAKNWKQPNCPSANEWVNKRWYIQWTTVIKSLKKKLCSGNMLQHGGNLKTLC